MAITIIQQPERLQPAYNQLQVTASSTNSGEDGFKYVVKVYIWQDNDGAFTNIFNALVPPNPDGIFSMNFSEIISQYVDHDLTPAEAGFKKCGTSIVRYYVSLNEYYDSTYQAAEVVTGTITNYTSELYGAYFIDNTQLAWNAALTFKDFQSYDSNDWLNTSVNDVTNDAQLLTSVTVNKIYTNQNSWVYGIYESPSGILVASSCYQARVKTYSGENGTGTLLGTFLIANNYQNQDVSGVGEYMMRFPCGTYNLNQINFGDFYSGAQPVIDANVASYTVQIGNYFDGAQYYDDIITYNIEDNCNAAKGSNYRLHWLNRHGGFDSFNFNCRSDVNDNNSKLSYTRMLGGLNGSNSWEYDLHARTKITMNSNTNIRVVLNSDNITETESQMFRELISSPVVFVEISATEVYATEILTSSYNSSLKNNDKVTNFQVEITLPEYNAQRY